MNQILTELTGGMSIRALAGLGMFFLQMLD